jgi:hypothetical protein
MLCSIPNLLKILAFVSSRKREREKKTVRACTIEDVGLLYLADTEALLNRFVVCPDAG